MALVDRRKANREWRVTDEAGELHDEIRDGVQLAVLLDIRDELQKLNHLLHCSNFTGIPRALSRIRSNTEYLRPTKKTK